MNRYGHIRFAHVHERVSTQSFVVLMIGNSKSNHLGAQGTFNLDSSWILPRRAELRTEIEQRKKADADSSSLPSLLDTPSFLCTQGLALPTLNSTGVNPTIEGGAAAVRHTSHARVVYPRVAAPKSAWEVRSKSDAPWGTYVGLRANPCLFSSRSCRKHIPSQVSG